MSLLGGPVLDAIPGKHHFGWYHRAPLRGAKGAKAGVTAAFEPRSTYEQLQGLTVPSGLVRKK